MKFYYHGTNGRAAKKIKEEGFVKNSYFAKDLKDALEFGGKHIIWVLLESKKVPDSWQFRVPFRIKPDLIYKIEKYEKPKTLLEKDWMRELVFQSSLPREKKLIEETKQMKNLIRKGVSLRAIGKQFGMSYEGVRQRLIKYS